MALVVFVWHSTSSAFLQDDSFITYRYARNVVRGLGPVFNPGERVEGYTNFIWMMLLAALGILGLPFTTIIPLSQVLGVICGAAVIFIMFQTVRRVTSGPPLLAPAAVLLLAFNGAFAYWCVSGMETGLFSLLVAAAYHYYLKEHTVRNLVTCSTLFGLASLTRPEGTLFLALAVLDFGLRRLLTRSGKTATETVIPGRERRLLDRSTASTLRYLAALVAPFVVLAAPLFVWRLAYYGRLFPNTFYAKTGLSVSYLKSGLQYLVEFYQAYGIWGLAFAVPVAVAARNRQLRPGSALFLAVIVLLGHALYTVGVGGDVLRIYRFFVPVLFLFYLLIGESIWLLSLPKPVQTVLLAALIPLTFFGPLARPRTVRQDIKRNHILETGLVDKMTATGRWLGTRLGPDDWFACTTIGAVSWYSDRNMVDMLGLTDSVIALHPEMILSRKVYWKERNYNTRHVLEKKPAYIYFSTGMKPSAAAERALFLRPRFRRGYYACPISLPSSKGPAPEVIYKARPGADTIPLDPVYEHPEFIDYYVDGINLLRRGPDTALAMFRRCNAICPPDFGYGYEWAGQAYMAMKPPKTDSAIRCFEEAVRRDDYCVSSHTSLGSIYAKQGEKLRAAEHLRKVVEYAPDSYDGYVNLAVIATALGSFAEAESALTRAAAMFPESQEIDIRLAYVKIEAGQLSAAQEILNRYLAKHPGDRNALNLVEYIKRKQPRPK
ncbi:MAG: tetratricopeptide repeat protein [candidate division WOR-3 bacterium]